MSIQRKVSLRKWREQATNALKNIIEGSISSVDAIIKWLFFSGKPVDLKQIKPQSPFLLVMGNGPSVRTLLEEYPQGLKKLDVLCVNLAAIAPQFAEIRPRYYLIMDSFVVAENSVLQTLSKEHAEAIRKRAELLWTAMKKVDWKMDLLVPHFWKATRFPEIQRTLPSNIRTIYLNYTPAKGFPAIVYPLWKRNRLSPYTLNVVAYGIYWGLLLRYKKIFLIGVEHDILKRLYIDKENRVWYSMDKMYFYNDPYFKGNVPSSLSYKHYLKAFLRAIGEYEMLKAFADTLKIPIYNLTLSSYIDVFPKLSIKELKGEVGKCFG